MPDIEDLIDAIIRGQTKDKFEDLTAVQRFTLRNSVLGLLTPALATLNEMRADAWDEGHTAGIPDGMRSSSGLNPVAVNPYGGI